MKIFTSSCELQKYTLELKRSGKTIGFVPTMGFLHDGHMSLIDIARQKSDVVVVSIFVNPTQFAPNEDFDRYPRDFDGDVAKCAEHGADVIYAPEATEMYRDDASTWVEETVLSRPLCGKSRPNYEVFGMQLALGHGSLRPARAYPPSSLPLPFTCTQAAVARKRV